MLIRLRSSYTFIDDTDGTGVSFPTDGLNIHVQMKVMFLNAVKNITFIWNIESGTSSMKVYSQHQYSRMPKLFYSRFPWIGESGEGFFDADGSRILWYRIRLEVLRMVLATSVDRPVSRSIDGVETGYWCWIRLRSSYTFIDDTDGTGVSFLNWRAQYSCSNESYVFKCS